MQNTIYAIRDLRARSSAGAQLAEEGLALGMAVLEVSCAARGSGAASGAGAAGGDGAADGGDGVADETDATAGAGDTAGAAGGTADAATRPGLGGAAPRQAPVASQ